MELEALNAGKPIAAVALALRRVLNDPQPVRVQWRDGMPARVDSETIESLRESWLVEDRWWTTQPVRRRYWELVGERGRNVVVFHDLCSGRWCTH